MASDPNGVGDANHTALFHLVLVQANDPKGLGFEIANLLLENFLKAGAKPDWLNKFGSVPLEGALMRQNPGAIKLLLEAGADVNRIFTRGTALDINETDISRCGKDLKELLASTPADEKIRERHKKLRPLMEEKVQRYKEIGNILSKFGGKRKSELPSAS